MIKILRYEEPVPYQKALDEQLRLRDAVQQSTLPGALILLQHPPTFTLGRNAHEEHLLRSRDDLARIGIEVIEVDRGGDVTYHGPGQLVAYPILDLNNYRLSISWYLRTLEQVLIDLLNEYDLKGERVDGMTGVWVNGGKIAAVGVGIHQWVTYHGISINLETNKEHWGLIVPCGIPDKPVTSLSQELASPPSFADLRAAYERHFMNHFGAALSTQE